MRGFKPTASASISIQVKPPENFSIEGETKVVPELKKENIFQFADTDLDHLLKSLIELSTSVDEIKFRLTNTIKLIKHMCVNCPKS